MKLQHKTAIITGASDGIGKAISLRLAEEGVQLALVARNKARLEDVNQLSLEKGSPKVETYTCDISNKENIEACYQKISAEFPTINILINNAGIWQKKMDTELIDPLVVDEVFQTNLIGHIHFTRLVIPALKAATDAAVINIISKSGVVAQKGQAIYTASKWGMRGFTEVLKTDLEDSHVKVAGVYQSGTNTNIFRKTGEDFVTDKFTEPADLADVIVYMLSRPPKIWLHEVRVEK